jgi:hypothetical protein
MICLTVTFRSLPAVPCPHCAFFQLAQRVTFKVNKEGIVQRMTHLPRDGTYGDDSSYNRDARASLYTHCYPFSSQLVLNLTLALSWVQRGHLLKLCYKRHIRVLHLTVHELAFGGRNREKKRAGSNVQSPVSQSSAVPLRHIGLY